MSARAGLLAAIVLATALSGVLLYRLAPVSRPVAAYGLPRQEIDAASATITVAFENPIIEHQFDEDRAERFIEDRFRVDIEIENDGRTSYREFIESTTKSGTIRALFTTWSVTRSHEDGTYAGLSSPTRGVIFVSGSTAFERIEGHYIAFAHEYGHMLGGAVHSPYGGNLMSEPIDGDRLCDCPGDPYARWAR